MGVLQEHAVGYHTFWFGDRLYRLKGKGNRGSRQGLLVFLYDMGLAAGCYRQVGVQEVGVLLLL